MSRKASVKGNHVEKSDMQASNVVVPGTEQSGAIEPSTSAPGASEPVNIELNAVYPGTAESGAIEVTIVDDPPAQPGVAEIADQANSGINRSQTPKLNQSEQVKANLEKVTRELAQAVAAKLFAAKVDYPTPHLLKPEPFELVAANSESFTPNEFDESVKLEKPDDNIALHSALSEPESSDASLAPDARLNAIDLQLREAFEISQAGDLVAANVIYRSMLAAVENSLRERVDDPESHSTDGAQTHAQLVDCLWNLANNLYVLNEVEESIPLFKRLVQVQEDRLGSENDQLITPLLRLAIALKRAGDAAESEETFQRSMALAKQVNPNGHIAHTAATSDAIAGKQVDAGFVHPLAESMQSQSSEAVLSSLSNLPPVTGDSESEVLKYLFSDNAPAHVVQKISDIKPAQPSAGRKNVLSRSQAPAIDYEKGFVDRNPAATRLSELDLAALGSIPSPDAMKTMFSEATFSDPQARSTRSTAFLKANEGGDEPVKFADSVKRFDAKESAPFLVRNKWLVPTAVAVTAVFAIGFIVKSVSDKNAEHSPAIATTTAYAQPDKTFASFDKQTVLQVYKDSIANFTTNEKSHRGSCVFLDGDPRDIFRVLPGSYTSGDIWMQAIPEGLKQSDGTVLYSSNAPLNGVVRQMTEIAQSMQAYYGVNHSYPTTPEQFQTALNSAGFVNSFTHKGDPPKFFTTYSSTIGSSAKKLEVKTEAGENWINETDVQPGEIHCCSLIYEDPAGRKPGDPVSAGMEGTSGSGTDFFIRGVDVDGHYIAGSKPGSSFYIELNQGKSSALSTMLNGLSKPLDLSSKTRVLVAKDFTEQMLFLFLSGAVPALLLMGIGGAWFIQHQLYEEKDQVSQLRKKVVTQVLVVSSILLAVWIAMCAVG